MISIAVLAEDELGFRLVDHLTDQVMLEIDWVERDSLGQLRSWWAAPDEGDQRIRWTSIDRLFKKTFGDRARLHTKWGAPTALDEVQLRKFFLLLQISEQAPALAIVARDTDHRDRKTADGGRYAGLRAAREISRWSFAIVGAFAVPAAEAWLICSWCPANEPERRTLALLRQELGLDPVRASHDLESTGAKKRHCKSVLGRLESDGRSAWDAFAGMTARDLEAEGEHNGLTDFIREVRAELHRRLGAAP